MHNETVFQLLFLAIFVSGATIAFRHRRRAAVAGKQAGDTITHHQEGKWIFIPLRLFGLAIWLTAFAYMLNPAWVRWSQVTPFPDALRWLGAVLGISIMPLIYWATQAIGTNVTTTVVTRTQHELVTHGPYRWIRHPLYSFGAVWFVGLSLLAANGLMLLALVFGGIMLIIRLPKEEAGLIERFGDDYRMYMERTGRFFPKLTG